MVAWAELAAVLGALIGLALVVAGVLTGFAAGMASSPSAETHQLGRQGCGCVLSGFALFGLAAWVLL